uniref:Unkown protein n=1 Tax=Riptortus pedestris TaxID=329032 RepID=R4WE94_RIPPE|nr:unkown protein [Riptortus pedestris]
MWRFVFGLLVAVGTVLLVQLPSSHAWPESCGNNKTHNFSWGKRGYYDRLMYSVEEVKASSFLRKLSYDVTIPPKGTPQKGAITYLEVLDRYTDGNGGCAYLNGGGIGFRNVTLHIKSQRNKGVNFVINVYGLFN